MYDKCFRVHNAHKVFDEMPECNAVSWTALMCGYLNQEEATICFCLFVKIGRSNVKPNDFTFSTGFKACGILGIPENGMQVHCMCIKEGFEWNIVVSNSIIDMYSKCRKIMEAHQVFVKIPTKNVICWNTMIAGRAHNGHNEATLYLFREMLQQRLMPDEFTFTSTLKACSGSGAIIQGSQIHGFLVVSGFPYLIDTLVAGALIDLHVKSLNISMARKIFNLIDKKTSISWSSLILGYTEAGYLPEAMDLFKQLRESTDEVDTFVLCSLMGSFADLALVEQGKQMHCYIIKVHACADLSVANSIVDMYLKCGLVEEGGRFFALMPVINLVSWTVMITGLGKHGMGKEAIRLFDEMHLYNIDPDEVCYLALLSACSHCGLHEESQKYLARMCVDNRVKPRIEHYACVADVLGRAGQLKQAKHLIETMPIKPNICIWQTLLGACRLHGNTEISKEAGDILLKLDSSNPDTYVMLSNIYADVGYWRECASLRLSARKKGLKKEPGCSWVEINKEICL